MLKKFMIYQKFQFNWAHMEYTYTENIYLEFKFNQYAVFYLAIYIIPSPAHL